MVRRDGRCVRSGGSRRHRALLEYDGIGGHTCLWTAQPAGACGRERTYADAVKRASVGSIVALTLCVSVAFSFASAVRADQSDSGNLVDASGPTELCRFDGERLAEISGLAYSALHAGIVWAHNDSGGGARLYALDVQTCEIRAVLRVPGVKVRDPEAIATGTGATGGSVLWWGDVGDNTSSRRFVEIYEIAEPSVLRSGSASATAFRIALEDPQDSEALLADGDQLWLIGKGLLAGTVWELPRPLRTDRPSQARAIGTDEALVTDAAMRPGGGYAVRDYSEVRIYSGSPPGVLEGRMPLPEQVQGEAMTWTPDGAALIIASEGDDRLLLVPVGSAPQAPVTDPAAEQSAQATLASPAAPSLAPQAPSPDSSPVVGALQPVDRIGSLAVVALAIGAGVLLLSAAAVAIAARVRSRQHH